MSNEQQLADVKAALSTLTYDEHVEMLRERIKELTEIAKGNFPSVPDFWIEASVGKYIREEEAYLIPEGYQEKMEEEQRKVIEESKKKMSALGKEAEHHHEIGETSVSVREL